MADLLSKLLSEMTFNVIIRNPDKAGMCRVYLFCRINGKPCSVPTKIKIKTGTWDVRNKKIKSSMAGHERLNGLLTKRKAQLQQVFDDLEYEGITPTVKGVKERYERKRKGEKKKDPAIINRSRPTVADLMFKYKEDNKNIRSVKGYLRKFGTFARHLNTYAEVHERSIYADEFGLLELTAYINDYLVEELELSNNSIWDHVKKIRRAMETAPRDVEVHPDHTKFSWKYMKVRPVYLKWSEVELIEKFEPLPEMQIYKEEFLFRCYTGLRWSDCYELKPHHFIKTKNGIEIDFTILKTALVHNILLSSKAAEIVEKWGYEIPKLKRDDCSKNIKQICRAAGIKEMKERVKISGSNRTAELLPKYELITTHVARRTFGRRWMELSKEKNGAADFFNLMKYYGHSSIQQTIDYIGWEQEEVNAEMKQLFG